MTAAIDGGTQQFVSFAVAFSFISITTGIFTTYAFALATGGTRAIWTWPIQWASRLASTHVGW